MSVIIETSEGARRDAAFNQEQSPTVSQGPAPVLIQAFAALDSSLSGIADNTVEVAGPAWAYTTDGKIVFLPDGSVAPANNANFTLVGEREWGSLTGDITNQSDLQSALGLKVGAQELSVGDQARGFNRAIRMGSTGALFITDDAALDVGVSDFTMFAWLKVPSSATSINYVMEKYSTDGFAWRFDASGNCHLYLEENAGSGGQFFTINHDLRDDQFHFIAITCDRDGLATLYVDGVSTASVSIAALSADNLDNSASFRIFNELSGSNREFLGMAANYAGYTKDLITPAELALIAQDPHAVRSLDNMAACVDISGIAQEGFRDRSSNAFTVGRISPINYYGHPDALPWASAPATASSSGITGQVARDSSYLYICTATDTWMRVAIATW